MSCGCRERSSAGEFFVPATRDRCSRLAAVASCGGCYLSPHACHLLPSTPHHFVDSLLGQSEEPGDHTAMATVPDGTVLFPVENRLGINVEMCSEFSLTHSKRLAFTAKEVWDGRALRQRIVTEKADDALKRGCIGRLMVAVFPIRNRGRTYAEPLGDLFLR